MDDLTKQAMILAQNYKGGGTQNGVSPTNTLLPKPKPETEGNFLTSAISAVPETIGFEAFPGVEDYRAENPKKGIASQVLGMAVPYIAGGKAASLVPAIENTATKLADKVATPFLKGAVKETVRLAPVEATRFALDATVSPEDIQADATESAMNLGLGFVGTGLVHGIIGAGKVAGKAIGGIKIDEAAQPKQMLIRTLNKAISEGTIPPESLSNANGKIKEFEMAIRRQPYSSEAVRDLEGLDPVYGKEASRKVGRMFSEYSQPPGEGSLKKRRLIQGVSSMDTFQDDKKLNSVLEISGLKNNFDAVAAPRHLEIPSEQLAKSIDTDFRNAGFKAVDDITMLQKEKNGLYVMARKTNGSLATPSKGDEWVVWKTDQPGRFLPEQSEYKKQTAEANKFWGVNNKQVDPSKPSDILDFTQNLANKVNVIDFNNQLATGNIQKAFNKVSDVLGLSGDRYVMSQRMRDFGNRYLKPRLYQYKDSPLASYMNVISEATHANADQQVDNILFGAFKDSTNKTGYGMALENPQYSGLLDGGRRSVDKIINSLDDTDLETMFATSPMVAGAEDVATKLNELRSNGDISDNLYKAFQDLDYLDNKVVTGLQNHMSRLGLFDMNPLKGHMMLSRVWEGDFRAPIYNSEGKLVFMASGKNPKAANELAEKYIKSASDEGALGLTYLDADKVDKINDFEFASKLDMSASEYQPLAAAAKKISKAKPQTFKNRSGVEGYKTEYSKKDLLDQIRGHLDARYKYMADTAIRNTLEDEFMSLGISDPAKALQIADRLDQMAKKPGASSVALNKLADSVLKPVLGRNSANKIVSAINGAQYHLGLGMFNASYPIMNMISVLQNVMPETAFVLNASDDAVVRNYYETALVHGGDFRPRGTASTLAPFKMLRQGFKLMSKPTDEFKTMIQQATRQGVIDPQLVEEFVGSTSRQTATLSDVLKGEESISKFIAHASSYLPTKSERLSRGISFATGYNVGKDLLKLEGDKLYSFAKKFTERTQYNYTSADRPTVITGPMGRAFGLFKNWQIHYIHSLMQYADEGLVNGNWSPFMYQMAMTGGLGGVSALPFHDQIAQVFGQKDALEATYKAFGNSDSDNDMGNMSDAVYFGLPAFLGTSLSGSLAVPGADPLRDAGAMMNFPQLYRAQMIGKALGASVDRMFTTGQNPLREADVKEKWIAALAPKALVRLNQVTKDNALKSLTSDKIILKDMTPYERLMWQAGFTPKRVGVAYEANDKLWKNQEAKRALTTNAGLAWAEAQQAGDFETLRKIQIRAIAQGLDLSSVTRSANSYIKKQSGVQTENNFAKEEQAKMRAMGLVP